MVEGMSFEQWLEICDSPEQAARRLFDLAEKYSDGENSFRKRLFDALDSDQLLKRALWSVDHEINVDRCLVGELLDMASAQKYRADKAEARLLGSNV